ncbi:hypothetical protein [Actinocorallia aurea]
MDEASATGVATQRIGLWLTTVPGTILLVAFATFPGFFAGRGALRPYLA